MSFQAFLFAGVGFLLSGFWPSDLGNYNVHDLADWKTDTLQEYVSMVGIFRIFVIFGLGLVGYLLSSASFVGIAATRISIGSVKKQFSERFGKTEEELSEFYRKTGLHQIHGRGSAFFLGNSYTYIVPTLLYILWLGYLSVFCWTILRLSEATITWCFFTLMVLPLAATGIIYWVGRDQPGSVASGDRCGACDQAPVVADSPLADDD